MTRSLSQCSWNTFGPHRNRVCGNNHSKIPALPFPRGKRKPQGLPILQLFLTAQTGLGKSLKDFPDEVDGSGHDHRHIGCCDPANAWRREQLRNCIPHRERARRIGQARLQHFELGGSLLSGDDQMDPLRMP